MRGFKTRSLMVLVTGALTCALSMGNATAASADVPGAREAWRLMFGTRGAVSAVSDAIPLSATDRDIIERLGPTQKYYGAIAFSPDEGLISEATIAAANHHTVAVARGLALAECNAKRAAETAPCVIAADIVPRRYRPGQALELSLDATLSLGNDFRNAPTPRAFAISPQTGLWGIGRSDAEAIAACSMQDCKVVVRD